PRQLRSAVVFACFVYARCGHTEGDDPTMTQPLMYLRIKNQPTTRELYSQRLIKEGVATVEEIDGWLKDFDTFLEAEFEAGKTYAADRADWLDGKWAGLAPEGEERRGDTAVPLQKLRDLGLQMTAIPSRVD